MYKKINTTRNSSFKKASIFIAVAAFASCAVFFGTERFNHNGEEASSVYADLIESRGLFSPRRGRNFFNSSFRFGQRRKSYKSYDDHNLSDLTVNQRANFDLVVKRVKLIIKQMQDKLTNLNDMPERITEFKVDGLGNIPTRVAEHLFRKNDVFDKLTLPQDDPYSTEELFRSMKDCFQGLRDCQFYLFEVIQSMETLLELDHIKGADKIEELKNSDLKKSINCPNDLIKLADIKRIKEAGDSSIKKAKDIITKAKSAFVHTTTFNEAKQDDPWATNWAARNADHYCYKLVATLQTLLYINQQINLVYKHVIASEVVGSLQQFIKAAYSSNFPGVTTTAWLGKLWIFKEFILNGRMDLLLMPLLLATATEPSALQQVFKGVNFEAAGKIKELTEKYIDLLVKAPQSGRQARDLTGLLNDLINKAVNSTQNQDISYDLKEVLVGGVKGQTTKELLQLLDDTLKAIFSPNNFDALSTTLGNELQNINTSLPETFVQNQGFPAQFALPAENATPAEKQQTLRRDVEVTANALKEGGEKYQFVDNAGRLTSANIEIRTAVDAYHAQAAIATTKGAATVLSVPEFIRNSALVKLIIDKYNYNYNSTAILEDDFNSWFSITRFNSAVSEVVGKIQSIYSDSKKAIDKVSQVKSKEKSARKTKKESRESESSRSITNMLLLDAGNRNSKNLAVEAQGKTIEVSNLPSDVKKLSPVLCPKVSTNSKEGDKNIDLPLVDVADGSATIDLTSQLNAAGNYELHFRNAVLDPATKNVKEYKFLRKSKFAYAADKTKPQSMSKVTVDQADNSNLNFSAAEAIINEGKSVTYRVKAKSDASSTPETMTAVCFKSGTTPNLEKDKFALQLAPDKKTYSFTTNKGVEGNLELHVYNGEVEEGNYEGKIVAKTAETTELESQEGTSIYSIIDKNESSTSSAADGFTERTVKFVISEYDLEDFLDPNSNYFDYEILDGSGKVVCYGTTDRSRKSTKNRGHDNVYQVSIKVPKGDKEYTIRLAGSYADDMVLESFKRISSKTEINEEIGFRSVQNNWDRNYWF